MVLSKRNGLAALLLVVAILTLASASCAGTGSSGPTAGRATVKESHELTNSEIANLKGPARQNLLLEGAKKEGALLWYTQLIEDQAVRPIVAGFTQKYPFIKLDYVRSGGAQLLQRLINEAQAGKTIADVYDGTVAGGAAKQAGLAEPFTFAEEDSLAKKYVDPDHMWVAFTVYFNGLAYNTNVVPADQAPKTYQDLLDPRWKGKIAWTSDPGNGAPVLITALRQAWGEQKTIDYLKKLSEQKVTDTQESVRALLDTTISGENPISLNIMLHHVVISLGKKAPVGYRALPPVPSQAPTVILVKNAPHPYSAMLFIDYLLSEEGQAVLSKANYPPVNPKLPVPEAFKQLTPAEKDEYFIRPEIMASELNRSVEIYKSIFRK